MSKSKRGLGRGLSALIPPAVEQAADQQLYAVHLPISSIIPNPYQPRRDHDAEALKELADSIKEHGVIQPLIVARSGKGYQLIAGERRLRASQMAGLSHVPAIFKESTPQEMLELALVENLQRTDLNPLEAAAAYQQLIDEFNLTQAEVAAKVGKSRVAITNTLRLLNLTQVVQIALLEGRITEGHARALLALDDAGQATLLELIEARRLNVRQTEALVQGLLAEEQESERDGPSQEPTAHDRAVVYRIEERLGTKVLLKRARHGGRLIIHFYSEEELHSIFETIVGSDQI